MSGRGPVPKIIVNGQAAQAVGADQEPADLEIPESAPWPAPPDPAAYHGLAGDVVRLIEPETEADPVAVLVQTLVMFGNACGRHAHFRVEADRHYGNLYCCLVGETAKGRKGTSKGRALEVFSALSDNWATKRIMSGLSSGEGLACEVRDPVTGRQPVREGGQVVDYEEVVIDEGVADKRLMLIEGEFATTLRVMAREGNTLSGALRNAWDCGSFGAITKNNRARATDAHVSLITHVTRTELLQAMRSCEAFNGFANRFVWLAVRRSKLLPLGGMPVDLGPLAHKVALAVERAWTVGEVPFDGKAAELWCDGVYAGLSAGRPGVFGAVTNRAEAQVRRLALLYALLDFASAVSVEHLLAALAVWDFCERSARWIWTDSTGSAHADEILYALQEAGNRGLSQRELYALFNGKLDRAGLAKALAVLTDARLAHHRDTTPGPKGGRPGKRWYAAGFGGNQTLKPQEQTGFSDAKH